LIERSPDRSSVLPRPYARWVAITAWIAALAALTAGVAALVGWISAADGAKFDWSHAIEASVATGTVLLAAFTAALARTTSRDVTATQELARIAAHEQRLREEPILTAAILKVERQRLATTTLTAIPTPLRQIVGRAFVSIQVDNLGGAAREINLVAAYDDPTIKATFHPRSFPVLARGASTSWALYFDLHEQPEGGLVLERFRVEGTCRDRTRQNTYEIVMVEAPAVPPHG
jgi:hypothetical protein